MRIALLIYTCGWFGWFAPAHQRGVIRLDDEQPASASCCSADQKPKDRCHSSKSGSDKSPMPDPVRRCAVCHLVAKIEPPPIPDLSVRPLGFVEFRPPFESQRPVAFRTPLLNFGRAPPVFSMA